MPSTAQTTHVQVTSSSPVPPIDASNDTPDQQRRRNSSVAKLLGGQSLNNQQYEEIHQKILSDQTAQGTTNNNDNGITDTGIQRSRSSLTRTLLMNAERNNNTPTTNNTTTAKGRPPSPLFSKDFEYLIRRELDIEHAPSTLHRNSLTPSVFQNLSSTRNTPPANAQSPSQQSRSKRKRPNPKQTVPSTINKSPITAPFAIRNPFELDSSSPSLPLPVNATAIRHSHHHQNDVYHFDGSHHSHHQNQQQQYSLPINNSHSFSYPKLNQNSPVYAQYKNHHDRIPKTSPCISSSTSSPLYNCCCYPPTTELALPSPVSSLSSRTSSPSIMTHNNAGASARKTKVVHTQPDIYEIPVQRSYSTISNQSNTSSSSSSLSSGHSAPLKKRLLHAYTNEQRPSSLL